MKAMKTVDTKRSGFTIVELIITVIVIAILAGIILVSYRGIRENANSTAALSDLATARDQLKIHTIKNAAPSDISEAGVDTTGKSTFDYWLYDLPSGTVYCLSATRGTSSHYIWSHQNIPPREGSCADAKSLDTDSFLGLRDTAGALEFPSTSTGDFIMYTAVRVLDNTGYYNTISSTRPSSPSPRMQLDTSDTGGTSLRSRIDTSVGSNLTMTQVGSRTVGDHIGWLMVKDNATTRQMSYDTPTANLIGSLAAHDGFSFTGVNLAGATSSTEPLVTLAFKAAHDEQTRGIVLKWIERTYSLTLPQ